MLKIIGNHHWKEIDWGIPEWNKDDDDLQDEPGFWYQGDIHFSSEFMKCNKDSEFGKLGYHGVCSLTAFSGLLLKLKDGGEAIQIFRYYS